MKFSNLTIVLIAVASMGFSQTEENRTYSKARVYLKDHTILKVKNLEMNSIEASFLNRANAKKESVSMDKVNFVKVKKGNYLWDGALYGAASMTLSAVLIDTDEDSLTRPKKFGAQEYIGFALIGAGLGALIGSLFPKWEDAYSEGKIIGQNVPFKMAVEASPDLAAIKIIIPL